MIRAGLIKCFEQDAQQSPRPCCLFMIVRDISVQHVSFILQILLDICLLDLLLVLLKCQLHLRGTRLGLHASSTTGPNQDHGSWGRGVYTMSVTI